MKSKVTTLHLLFIHELEDIYDAENQILAALPKMITAAADDDLKAGFSEHLEQTRNHITRIEEIADTLDTKLSKTNCPGMAGVIQEGKSFIEADMPSDIKDAALISAAQRVEHYEMAVYHSLVAMADVLGYDDAEDLLSDTLSEEMETSDKLESLAEGGLFSNGINEAAAEAV